MLDIPSQFTSLKFIRPILWEEIFESWKKGEAHQPSWRQHWEEMGFDSWDEWRRAYTAPLDQKNLEWFLFEIENPLRDVPNFYAVPSRGWIEKAYQGEKTKLLKDITFLPIISNNDKIEAIKKDFPERTMLTGIVHGEDIILYEGMHRASAIASWPKNTKFGAKVSIALALWNKKEFPIVGGNYKK